MTWGTSTDESSERVWKFRTDAELVGAYGAYSDGQILNLSAIVFNARECRGYILSQEIEEEEDEAEYTFFDASHVFHLNDGEIFG